MIARGTALVDDELDRTGDVQALELDEKLFAASGPLADQGVVHLYRGRRCRQLLDMIPGTPPPSGVSAAGRPGPELSRAVGLRHPGPVQSAGGSPSTPCSRGSPGCGPLPKAETGGSMTPNLGRLPTPPGEPIHCLNV